MTKLTLAIEKHLQRRIAEHDLNHYRLLGISTNAHADEIKRALKATAAAWNASDTKSNPESAQLVAKLLKQAQTTLLNPASKIEYDKQIAAESLVAANIFFPDRNPFESFDPAACLVSAASADANEIWAHTPENGQLRWRELQRCIPPLCELDLLAPLSTTKTFTNPSSRSSHSPALEPTQATKLGASLARIEQLKRARRNKQRLVLAGVCALAILFLGYSGVSFVLNRSQVAQQSASTQTTSDPSPPNLASGPKPFNAPNNSKGRSNQGSEDFSSGLPSLIKETSDPVETPPVMMPEMTPDLPPNMPDMPATTPPDTPSPVTPPPVTPPAIPAPGPETNPNAMSTKNWALAMTKSRAALDAADFANFHQQMEIALPLSSNDEMLAKRARLDQLGQLYEIFTNSLEEGKTKLKPNHVLTVGKNKLNIVEISSSELTIRIQGKNEKFAWDRLPPGIALAIADQTLNQQSPIDNAARAVYFSLSPTRNDIFDKKVKDWFEKSVGQGQVREDLQKALTDQYE
jgi:curved DNA-binding protein CbpA